MFENFRDPKLLKLWKSQNKIKKETEKIFSLHEKGDSSVLLRGDKKIEKIIIDGVENRELRDLLNDAMKKLEKKLEKDLKGSASDILDLLK